MNRQDGNVAGQDIRQVLAAELFVDQFCHLQQIVLVPRSGQGIALHPIVPGVDADAVDEIVAQGTLRLVPSAATMKTSVRMWCPLQVSLSLGPLPFGELEGTVCFILFQVSDRSNPLGRNDKVFTGRSS